MRLNFYIIMKAMLSPNNENKNEARSSNEINVVVASEASAIISGLLGGLVYGLKLRLPHAFIMTMLFKRNLTSKQKLKTIVKLVWEHSSNLAAFATLYKTILAILKHSSHSIHSSGNMFPQRISILRSIGRKLVSIIVDGSFSSGRRLVSTSPGLPERPYHAAMAGAIGGYFVWGRYSAVNNQIVLYLVSRVLTSLVHLAREKGIPPFNSKNNNFQRIYPLEAAFVWGAVMFLYEQYPHTLHKSLKFSMDEIYRYIAPISLSQTDVL